MLTWLDYLVIAVFLLAMGWGAWRGLVRVVAWLGGWVIAFLAASLLAAPVGERLPDSIANPDLRVLVAYVGIFILSLVVTTLAGLLVSKLLSAAGLGGLDRALGALAAIVPGLIVVVAFSLLAGLTPLPRDGVWKGSASAPFLERIATSLKPWLPPAFSERLRYH